MFILNSHSLEGVYMRLSFKLLCCIPPPCSIRLSGSTWRTGNLEHLRPVCVMNVQVIIPSHGRPPLRHRDAAYEPNTKIHSASFPSSFYSPSPRLSPSPPPPLSSFCHRQTPSVCHTTTWQAARVRLCKFILKRSAIVPPHFLLIKISAHVAMIFLRGFFLAARRDLEKQDKERGKLFS